jgi:hypothetical protein
MITQLLIAIIYFWAKDSCNYCEIAAANCKRGLSKPCVGRQICHQDTVLSVFPQSHLELPQQLLHAALFLQCWLWENRQDRTIHWPDTGRIYDVLLLCWTGRSKKDLKSIENMRQLGVNAWSMICLMGSWELKHYFSLLVWHDNWASLFLVVLWCLYCLLSSNCCCLHSCNRTYGEFQCPENFGIGCPNVLLAQYCPAKMTCCKNQH